MEKYKLGILDPLAFEKICCSLLTIKTHLTFRTYKSGRDGGIDGEAEHNGKKVVAQCKRYKTFSSMFNALKGETEKLDKISNLEDYYILTSMELNPAEKAKIYDLFKEKYMHDVNNIIDGTVISNMLDDPANVNILKMYPSLWLYNSNIITLMSTQNILIDSTVLLRKISENESYYVDNSYFKKCLDKLNSNNCLLIYGNPGVGKTTISHMLLLYLVNYHKEKNVKVRFSSIANYEELKKAISFDVEEFEIIFVDDFLGTIYSEIEQKNTKGIIVLIDYIKGCKNKILILNSRMGILKNTIERVSFFERELRDLDISYVEIGEYNDLERAKILYKRFKNDLPIEYRRNIIHKSNYKNIIFHKNFNPRLIENISKRSFFEKIEPDFYYSKVLDTLNNPEEIWSDEYHNNLNECDKLLLCSVFSLSNTAAKKELVKEAFWYKIKIRNIDCLEGDLFNDSFKRLNEAFIILTADKAQAYVSMINNSLNDFFVKMQRNVPEFQSLLIRESYIPDQLVKIANWDLKKKCDLSIVYEYITDNLSDKYDQISKGLLLLIKERDMTSFDDCSYDIISKVLFGDYPGIKERDDYISVFLCNIFKQNMNLVAKYFTNKLKNDVNLLNCLCEKISYQVVDVLLCSWRIIDEVSYEQNLDAIRDIIECNYTTDFKEMLCDYAISILDTAIEYCEGYDEDGIFIGASEDEVFNYLVNEIEKKWLDPYEYHMNDRRLYMDFGNEDYEDIASDIPIEEEIRARYYEPDYDPYDSIAESSSDSNDIDKLFESLLEE